MVRPLAIPPLDEVTAADLRRRYDAASDPETRLRYQIVWLALLGSPGLITEDVHLDVLPLAA